MDQVMFVLGSFDPEMRHIVMILEAYGANYIQATYKGDPVTSNKAFMSDMQLDPNVSYVFVECRVKGVKPLYVIDHHNEGDPGFNCSAEEYWQGSSIGQLWRLLYKDKEPPHLFRVVAAADHCLADAYQGRCPGVSPEDLKYFRLQSRSQYQSISVRDLNAKIVCAMEKIAGLQTILIEGVEFKDARGERIDELPEASARLGIPVIYRLITPMGEEKIGILNADKIGTQKWMDWAKSQDEFSKVYGMPHRGIAGAYVTVDSP